DDTRIMTHTPRELGGIVVGDVLLRAGDIREIDLDGDVRPSVLEVPLELDDARLEELDPSLERHRSVVGRNLERSDRGGRWLVRERQVLDDNPVARFVR